ncbi:MAG: hypothetical protein A2W22_04575 [Candidatus Levybacteria bacterium RBG_16_35_11]|nr:MAG: hypothetical protein A2W22_04575 [Candidatus Levybacteria bacterium RBG_16_35_11]
MEKIGKSPLLPLEDETQSKRRMIDLTSINQGDFYLPDYYASQITDIDFEKLKQQGVRFALFDVDNTLTKVHENEIPQDVLTFLSNVLKSQQVEQIYLVSNSRRDLSCLARVLGATIIKPGIIRNKKPYKSFFNQIIETIRCKPEEVAMIGDKIVHDIYGARRLGIKTVLVDPIGPFVWPYYLFGLSRKEKKHRKHLEESKSKL